MPNDIGSVLLKGVFGGLKGKMGPQQGRPGGSMLNGRLMIALAMAAFALFSYFTTTSKNPVTGKSQHIGISAEQEVAIGLQSVPEMVQQFGGESNDRQMARIVEQVGRRLITSTDAAKGDPHYKFSFTLLDDDQTINAFALPGGPVFITDALANRLETEGQMAGVLGHEVGHVIARHGAQRIAKQQLTQGLTGSFVLATYDPNNPSTQNTAKIAMVVSQLVNMKYGREDELESDTLGVLFMLQAGYDPRAMIGVMKILQEAAGDKRPPEFMSTHPSSEHRIEEIEEAIKKVCPNGVPQGLIP